MFGQLCKMIKIIKKIEVVNRKKIARGTLYKGDGLTSISCIILFYSRGSVEHDAERTSHVTIDTIQPDKF